MLTEEAGSGRMPHEVMIVAKREGLEPERLARLVAEGRGVIPRNARRIML